MAVDAPRKPFYSSRNPRASYTQGNQSEFEGFNIEYEQQNFRYTEGGHRVASATRDMFLGWVLPPPLRRFAAPVIHALLDDPVLEGLGFPSPSPILKGLVRQSLRSRSGLTGLLPERRKPFLQTERRHSSYPSGYQIERLGPPVKSEPGSVGPLRRGGVLAEARGLGEQAEHWKSRSGISDGLGYRGSSGWRWVWNLT